MKVKRLAYMTSLIGFALSNASGLSATEYRFYHPDWLGSNVVISNDSGEVVQRSVSTPYGELRSLVDGTGQSLEPSADSIRHLFTDQEQDPESGLHYFGARFQDPVVGRFLSPDRELLNGGGSFAQIPLLPGVVNAYSYAANRPTTLVDPTGGQVQAAGGVCGPATPICVGGLFLITAGAIYMSQPGTPAGLGTTGGGGGDGPGPTPTPGPQGELPPDLPQQTPTGPITSGSADNFGGPITEEDLLKFIFKEAEVMTRVQNNVYRRNRGNDSDFFIRDPGSDISDRELDHPLAMLLIEEVDLTETAGLAERRTTFRTQSARVRKGIHEAFGTLQQDFLNEQGIETELIRGRTQDVLIMRKIR